MCRPEEIDCVTSAEIPNTNKDMRLHQLILAHMIHGPYGPLNRNSPCMIDQQYNKGFPKQFSNPLNREMTAVSPPKARSGRHTGQIHMRRDGQHIEQIIINQWVVSYHPVSVEPVQLPYKRGDM